MPTRKITRVFRRSENAVPRQLSCVFESASLIDVLNIMERNKLSILPVSSHKSLGILGRGLSGGIRQSTADVATVLAFKEGVPSKQERDTEEEQDWYSLVTEITVLQHPTIRDNPHFIDLLGVSIYVEPSSGSSQRAWPLLVTAKANRGDLSKFLRTEQHGLLIDKSRLQIFAEVTEAVHVLHTCGVAHGDIKPENVLIQQSESGELNCLMIDFGSSIIQGQKRVPTINEPWNAPSLRDATQVLEFKEMMQNDIFSFGLLSLHLLLPLKALEDANMCLIRRPGQSDHQWIQFIYQIELVKAATTGDTLASRFLNVIETSEISTDRSDLLRLIFAATILPPLGKKTLPWAKIKPYIDDYLSLSFNADVNVPVSLPPLVYNSIALDHSEHSIYDYSSNLGELDDTDYILARNIVRDLAHKAENSDCVDCRKEYAFHVAVCHAIGFGGSHEVGALYGWLTKAQKDQDDLNSALERIGNMYRFPGWVNDSVLGALGIGVLISADRTEEYHLSRRLAEAETTFKDAIKARALVFGQTHLCLAKLSSELSLVLNAQNRLEEAVEYQQKALEILNQYFGDTHPATLLAKITLSRILADQGFLRKALDTQRAIQPMLVTILGEQHPETITALQLLGNTLAEMGELGEAEEKIRAVISIRRKVLTPMHPLTIRAELSLVACLRGQGLLRQATNQLEETDLKLSAMPYSDYITKAHLYLVQSELYKALGSLDHAIEKCRTSLAAMDRLGLPDDDSLRLTGLQGLASMYGAGRQFEEEECILRQVLETRRSMNAKDRQLSATQCLLAQNLLTQTRLEEAYTIANEAVTKSISSFTEDPQTYMACINVRATVLSFQGKKIEAEDMRRQLFESSKVTFGDKHVHTMDVGHSLGSFLADEGLFDKAQRHYEEILEHLCAATQRGLEAIKIARLLAVAYHAGGQYENSIKQCDEGISWAVEAIGEKHIETLAIYSALLSVYTSKGLYVDAERLYIEKLEQPCKGTDLEMYVKNNMSQLRRRQGRYPEAAKFQTDAHDLMKLALGSRNPELLKMRSNVLCDSLREAKSLTSELEQEVLENIELKKQFLGICHPSTITTMGDLAYAYSEHGRLNDAEGLFHQIQEIGGLQVVQDPQRYTTLLGKWADICFRQGRLERAEELERKALNIRQQIFGDEHIAVLINMSNLGSTLHARRKYEEAEPYLRHVVTSRERSSLEDIQSIFRLLKAKVALGAVLFAQNKLHESLSHYEEVVQAATQIALPANIINVWYNDLQEVLKKSRSGRESEG